MCIRDSVIESNGFSSSAKLDSSDVASADGLIYILSRIKSTDILANFIGQNVPPPLWLLSR